MGKGLRIGMGYLAVTNSEVNLAILRLLATEAKNLNKEINDFINNFEKYTGDLLIKNYINYIIYFLNHYKDLYYRVVKTLPEISSALMDPDSHVFSDSLKIYTATKRDMIAKLKSVAAASKALADALESYISRSISLEDYDRLVSLREQVEEISDFNLNLYRHLVKAIDEYESGHFLASSLIAGKIVQYIYERLCSMFDAFEVREYRKECNKELVAKHIVNSLQIDRRYVKELLKLVN
jgi:hypothetical protein